MSWPMSAEQRDYIQVLRKQKNFSPDILDRLCLNRYGVGLEHLTVRDASNLIDALKAWAEIHREIQQLAGQQALL